MAQASTFFFCHILERKVLTPDGKTVGRLKDLIVDPAHARPPVVAAVVSCADGLKTLDFSAFDVESAGDRHTLVCREARPFDLQKLDAIHVRRLLNKKSRGHGQEKHHPRIRREDRSQERQCGHRGGGHRPAGSAAAVGPGRVGAVCLSSV